MSYLARHAGRLVCLPVVVVAAFQIHEPLWAALIVGMFAGAGADRLGRDIDRLIRARRARAAGQAAS
jgi:hypothetical protein